VRVGVADAIWVMGKESRTSVVKMRDDEDDEDVRAKDESRMGGNSTRGCRRL
jgi:hypothetical protein